MLLYFLQYYLHYPLFLKIRFLRLVTLVLERQLLKSQLQIGNYSRIATELNNTYISRGWYYEGGLNKTNDPSPTLIGVQNNGIVFFADANVPVNAAYSPTTRMVIQSNGNVGIGTSTPLTTLHVQGKGSFGDAVTTANATRPLNLASSDAVMRIVRVHATNAPAVELISRTTADGANIAYWDFYAEPSDASFRIRDRQGGGSGIDMVSISHTTGNVGIGTTNTGPYKLAVEGKIGAREIKVTLANPWADYVFNTGSPITFGL